MLGRTGHIDHFTRDRPPSFEVWPLQDHVKKAIVPFEYPRSVIFTAVLPKMQTGKIQRFQLRDAQVKS